MSKPLVHRLLRQWESPPTWLALFLLLTWLQARFLLVLGTGTAGRAAGMTLILAGVALMLAAIAQFRRHRTTVLPREAPSAMITSGVYARSRNPIYLADSLILAGAALLQDAAGLIFVPLFMAVITLRFIRGEEAALRAAFGQAFDDWALRTGRWI